MRFPAAARHWLGPLARLLLAASLLAAAAVGAIILPAAQTAQAAPLRAEYAPSTITRTDFDSGTCTANSTSVVKSGGGNVCQFDFSFAQPVIATAWRVDGAAQTTPDPWISIEAVKVDNTTVSLCVGSNFASNCGSGVTNGITGCGGGCPIKAFRIVLSGHTNDKTVSWTSLVIVGNAWTPTPSDTSTPTPTPTTTATPTATNEITGPGSFPSRNHLINTDFNTAPRLPASGWADIGRVVQAPLISDAPIEHMPGGSCGPKYWVMSVPGIGPGEGGEFFQNFSWQGGQMFINLEALTNDYNTRGQVTIINQATGEADPLPSFTNGSFAWQSFKWATEVKPAGEYRFAVSMDDLPGGDGSRPAVGIDNVNVRRGYWGNDCDPGEYTGQIPQQQQGTATPYATLTPNVPGDGANRLTNCGFEQGYSSWAHNAGARLFTTGGATGPTYSYLYTVFDNGSDPGAVDIPGHIWQPFNWPGGRLYVTYYTGPGSNVSTSIRNLYTGAVYPMQSAGFSQSFNGWTKRSYSFVVSDPGQIVFDARAAPGQIAALDGITASSGGFVGAGPCVSQNSSGDNNATATAHATSSQVAGTATAQPAAQQTAQAVQTTQAAGYDGYLTAQYATMTQNARQTQTARPPQTQTQAARQTQTQAARFTATAQGTPVPTFTATPAPTLCVIDPVTDLCWIVAPPVTVVYSPADLTATAAAAAATQTAQANAAQTQFVGIVQTQQAKQQQTQAAAQTQTAAPLLIMTQQAGLTATAAARAAATQTQAAAQATAAQATAQQLATLSAQQAQATNTAAALQTALAGAPDATAETAATSTAQAHATGAAQTTATAQAQTTADAVASQNAAASATPPPVEEQPEPAPGMECIRPSLAGPGGLNGLSTYLAGWIDYSVCRVLRWFTWTPDNTAQFMALEGEVAPYGPFGFLVELGVLFDVVRGWAGSLPWCETGFCQNQPLTQFNTAAYGVLTGQFTLLPGTPYYSAECDLLLAPLVGPGIQAGACFCVNVLCALGILPWTQLLFNFIMALGLLYYAQKTWFTSAHA